MDFIHKFIPKNPINDATLERIKDRVKQAVEVFAKNYGKKTKSNTLKKCTEKKPMFQISQKFL